MAVSSLPSSFRLQDHLALYSRNHFLSSYSFVRPPLRLSSLQFRPRIYASSAVGLEPEVRSESQETSAVDLFACPVCYEPLIRKGPSGFNLTAIYRSGFKCSKCNKTYSSKNVYLDLTVTAAAKDYNEFKPTGTELFSNLALVRADVSRLPFSSGSIDAVHAGAGLHCWPSPSNAVAEINRILRSGGVFVGTTFLRVSSSTPAFLRTLGRTARNYNYLTQEEIEDLCTSCGLINYSCEVQQSFIMFSAQKP